MFSDEVLKFIANNPGTTSLSISKYLSATTTRVSATLSYYTKIKTLRRTDKIPYKYFINSVENTKPVTKPTVIESTVKPTIKIERITEIDSIIDSLSKEIADKISFQIKKHLREEVMKLSEYSTIADQGPDWTDKWTKELSKMLSPFAKKERKPIILVVGLLPNQAGLINSEFGDKFVIRHWTKDQTATQLKYSINNVSNIFVFVDKIGHNIDGIVASSGKNYQRVSGGMTSLRKAILDYSKEKCNA